MRQPLARVAGWLAAAGAALGVALALSPGRAGLLLHVFLVVASGAALVTFVIELARSLRSDRPSAFERALDRRPGDPERVHQLVKVEREVALARQSAFDVHYRLRPTLREIAGGLLSTRRGIDLTGEPERAAGALGPDVWELVRPDRPAPVDRLARGIDAASLERVLSALEKL